MKNKTENGSNRTERSSARKVRGSLRALAFGTAVSLAALGAGVAVGNVGSEYSDQTTADIDELEELIGSHEAPRHNGFADISMAYLDENDKIREAQATLENPGVFVAQSGVSYLWGNLYDKSLEESQLVLVPLNPDGPQITVVTDVNFRHEQTQGDPTVRRVKGIEDLPLLEAA